MSLNFDCWQQLFLGWGGKEKLHASTERTKISVVVQKSRTHISSMTTILLKKLLTFCLVAPQQFLLRKYDRS